MQFEERSSSTSEKGKGPAAQWPSLPLLSCFPFNHNTQYFGNQSNMILEDVSSIPSAPTGPMEDPSELEKRRKLGQSSPLSPDSSVILLRPLAEQQSFPVALNRASLSPNQRSLEL